MQIDIDTSSRLDRTAINRALAKALAYKQCGKDQLAEQWAAGLVVMLECSGILSDHGRFAAHRLTGEI